MIVVIDYGMGNLRSVSKALESVGAETKVSGEPADIVSAEAIVLPGVGAFYRGMENLEKSGILPALFESIKKGKPFMGICLGLQLLFTESEEHGVSRGLNIIKGKVKRFTSDVKIPHMGWNGIKVKRQNEKGKMNIFKGIPEENYFYFVHSYYVEPEDKNVIAATTDYGKDFVSVVNQGNIWGMQFHPEKSSDLGLKILKNFVKLTR